MQRLANTLHGFWFEALPASRLALLRIAIGGYTLLYLVQGLDMLVAIGRTHESLFDPAGVAAFLNGPLPVDVFAAIVMATIVANVAFVLGWRHGVTGPVFALLLLVTLCYRNSWSTFYHSDNLLVLHTLVLGLAPSADAFSLDARRRGSAAGGVSANWRYGWPVKLICAVTVLAYFLAGVAKVSGPLGWSWAGGESLRAQVAVDALRKEVLGAEGALLSLPFDALPLFMMMGIFTLVFELGAPLALLGRRLSYVWALGAWTMHWGIFFVMGITFEYPLWGLAFLCFLPCERILARLGGACLAAGSKAGRFGDGAAPARVLRGE